MSIPIPTPDEFKKKVQSSVGMHVYLFLLGTLIGGGVMGFAYSIGEVGGLRSDWERGRTEDTRHFEEEIDRLESRLNSLEEDLKKYHMKPE